jgi:prevent-host-death family protein
MRKIQLKDAKANLSAVVDQAVRGKPSLITRHGKPEAVVLGYAEWERLSRVPSFGRLLMSAPLESSDLPERNRTPTRDSGL